MKAVRAARGPPMDFTDKLLTVPKWYSIARRRVASFYAAVDSSVMAYPMGGIAANFQQASVYPRLFSALAWARLGSITE